MAMGGRQSLAGIDRTRLLQLMAALGAALREPTTLLLIGSVPGVIEGQPERSTEDIDVWAPGSEFDTGDLAEACATAGMAFDPKGNLDGRPYIQLVRPGIVQVPADVAVETIGRFGQLTLLMPAPAALCAMKLTRASDSDVEDVVWWARQRRLTAAAVGIAIESLPDRRLRETARENLVFVRLVAPDDDR